MGHNHYALSPEAPNDNALCVSPRDRTHNWVAEQGHVHFKEVSMPSRIPPENKVKVWSDALAHKHIAPVLILVHMSGDTVSMFTPLEKCDLSWSLLQCSP